MNPNGFNHLNMSFTIAQTIRKPSPYQVQGNYYKFVDRVEEGLPFIPEPDIKDFSEALDVIARIKAM